MAPHQFWLFQRLRGRLLANSLAGLLRGGGLRLVTVLLCSAVVWGGLFAGSYESFTFLRERQLPLTGGIVEILFNLLFLSLAGLLVFSCSLILYGSLFNSAEAGFLLARPLAADQVFAYKFQAALGFSSWAFMLLGSPILLAYGLVVQASGIFYVLLVPFFLGFVLLPGSLAAVLTFALANWLPRRPRQLVLAVVVLVLAIVALWGYRVLHTAREGIDTRSGLDRLLSQVTFARGPAAPNHWMAQGLQAAAKGHLEQAGYSLALIWANGLFAYLIAAGGAKWLYRRGYNRVATGGIRRQRQGGAWLDRLVESALPGLDPQTRLLIVKDFRTFRRDPGQWGQVLIFSGLLVLYFFNVRHFFEEGIGFNYRNGVSLLNLSAVALLLCAYTGRFIFPLLSLEGRKFWILGLLPLSRERLLWGKFVFAATGGLVMAAPLILLSDWMLGMPLATMALHGLAIGVLTLGLSGLSVGLGAWLANFRETDPSKIAVGFGGTFNLVISLLFLIAVICLVALPWHLVVGLELFLSPILVGLIVGGILTGIGLGAAVVAVPLQLGGRRLRRMEF